MLKSATLFFFLSTALLLLISSCNLNRDDDDDPDTITSFTNGFFIVNQGISTGTDGSISFYDRGRKEVVNTIYTTKNGISLDGTLVGMTNLNERAYIVQNKIGNISITDQESMGLLSTITGFSLPRYLLPVGTSKAYVSQWGAAGGAGSIQIVDLLTNNITGEIAMPPGPDRMLREGNTVYVAQTGGFLLDSVISIIDITQDQVVKTVEVGISPQSLQLDANGALWVLSKGLESFTESKPGTLAKLVNQQVVFSMTLPLGSRDLVIDNNKNTLYFINGLNSKIYAHSINSNTLALAPFSEVPVTGLALDPVTGLLVGLDAGSFQLEGKMYFFDRDGKVAEEFGVGVVPLGVVF